jgi:(p)ppGpp synthase/HD superfamily hydrolase
MYDESARIIMAKNRVVELHKGQFRKDGTTPYYIHPLAVAELTAKYLGNAGCVCEREALLIAALSHDLVEDVPGFNLNEYVKSLYPSDRDYDSISEEVLKKTVLALTKNNKIKTRHGRDWDSYCRIIDCGTGAIIIKLCDRLNNISDMLDGVEKPGLSLDYQRRYIAETFYLLGFFKDFGHTDAYSELLSKTLLAAKRLY